MGEYIKYKGNETKIGTCESLYYTSYQKYEQALQKGQLSAVPGNAPPEAYSKPNSGYRFRFPFPDEDRLPFGDIESFGHDRGVSVKIEPVKEQETNEEWKTIAGKQLQLEITPTETGTQGSGWKTMPGFGRKESRIRGLL